MQYLFVLLVNFVSHYISKSIVHRKTKSLFDYMVIIFTMSFVCFGYMTGTDWRNYEQSYQWLGFDTFVSSIAFWEPGYIFLVSLFRFLHIDFWPFLITVKIITFLSFCSFLRKYGKDKFFLTMTFFLSFYGYYFWIDNPLRNLCAFTIFLFTIEAIYTKKKAKFIFTVALAVLFHYSAIIILPMYWILRSKFKTGSIVVIYLVVTILFLNINLMFKIIDLLFGWFPIIQAKLYAYSSEVDGKMFSLGFILHNIFFILILMSRKKIESLQYGNIIFMGAVVYVFIFRLGLTFTVFMRFAMYFAVLYSLAVIYVLNNLKIESKSIYVSYLLAVSMLSCYNSISKDYRYVPYSNYLEYIFKPKPSFEYRASYNQINSPYKTEE